jgi:ABC-type nitrate/sulfonate/bicarbonate transport system ATPase subunit
MIELKSLCFQYDSTQIFHDFTWSVDKGDSWAVLGPSGCGKSTLLSLLAGLRFPQSGTIFINKDPLSRPRPQTGLILQDFGLLPWATVRQNASLGIQMRTFYGADGIHAPKRTALIGNVSTWLDRLGLASVAEKYPAQISGGQRQRTAIARTLITEPDLLLMDEPFSSLDAPTREALQQLTLDLIIEQSLTLVLVTHSIEEAIMMGKKILLLKQAPNNNYHIFNNPLAGSPAYQETDEYRILLKNIRRTMVEKV